MKNKTKLFGIIALVAVIGFSTVACDNDPQDVRIVERGSFSVSAPRDLTATNATGTENNDIVILRWTVTAPNQAFEIVMRQVDRHTITELAWYDTLNAYTINADGTYNYDSYNPNWDAWSARFSRYNIPNHTVHIGLRVSQWDDYYNEKSAIFWFPGTYTGLMHP